MIFRFSLNFKNVNISRDVMHFLGSSMSDDSSFDEVSVWCFARVEWYWSQSVYGLQAVTVATSNSLFPFPM